MRTALFLILASTVLFGEDFIAPNYEKIVRRSLAADKAELLLKQEISKKYIERVDVDKSWTTYVGDAFKNNKPVCSKDSNLDGFNCFARVFKERQKVQPLTIAGLSLMIPVGVSAVTAKFARDKLARPADIRAKEAAALVDVLEVHVLCRESFPDHVKPSDLVGRKIAGAVGDADRLMKSGDVPGANDVLAELTDKAAYDAVIAVFKTRTKELLPKVAMQVKNMTPETKQRFFKLAEKLLALNSK